jgi:hypothetical protein
MQRTGQLVNRLQGLLRDLSLAITTQDASRLDSALNTIKRILATEPSLINARLTEAARALPLSALLSAFTRVCNELGRADVDKARLSEFKSGVEALQKLTDELNRLIDDHDSWQTRDNEVRRIEATVDRDVADLRDMWSELKAWTEGQCQGVAESWAASLLQCSQKLDAAIADQDQHKIRQSFNTYRRRIGGRFFDIDVNLKKLCDELRKIGDPLARVLEMLYGYQSN